MSNNKNKIKNKKIAFQRHKHPKNADLIEN